MECQCPGCSRTAATGGLLCQKCRDGIDAGLVDHPHKPLIPGSAGFNKKNDRRHALIQKMLYSTITEDEADELIVLQKEIFEATKHLNGIPDHDSRFVLPVRTAAIRA